MENQNITPRPAWVYWAALVLCLVLSIDKALSDSWAFNGQNLTASLLLLYSIQGLNKHRIKDETP